MRQTELCEIFGANLRATREAAGLSHRDLAERAELSQLQLPSIEAGIVSTTVTTAQRLADAFRTPLSDLLRSGG